MDVADADRIILEKHKRQRFSAEEMLMVASNALQRIASLCDVNCDEAPELARRALAEIDLI